MKIAGLFPTLAFTTVLLHAWSSATAQEVRIYNTVKSKLIAGQQVVGGTVDTADPEIYCAMANAA